jgi:hypothetical protein
MAADELADREKYRNRHFYFILRLPDTGDERSPKWLAVENLKSRYPQLDFVILGHARDGGIIRRERRQFGVLREILPAAPGKQP